MVVFGSESGERCAAEKLQGKGYDCDGGFRADVACVSKDLRGEGVRFSAAYGMCRTAPFPCSKCICPGGMESLWCFNLPALPSVCRCGQAWGDLGLPLPAIG